MVEAISPHCNAATRAGKILPSDPIHLRPGRAEYTVNEKTKETLSRGLGRVPSGCSILTAQFGNESTGMLVSWVQQASFDPPAITVCVKKGRPIETMIDQSGKLVVNLIGSDPGPMFKQFGKGFEPGQPAFEGVAHRTVPEGIVLEDGVGFLAGDVVAKHDAGDHWIYQVHVTDGEGDLAADPYVHVRKNGFSY